MITKLNLSSRPFRNRTLPYLLALLLVAFSVAGAVLCFAKLRGIDEQNANALKGIAQLNTELAELQSRKDQIQQELTPEQRALLIGAHKLAANKSFGWSMLFAQLERVLPGSVSASRIGVENVFRDGDKVKAELDFAVLSRDYQSVAQMIDNMNNSGVFRAELRGQDLQKTERLTYTEYTLRLIYTTNGAAVPAAAAEPNQLAKGQGGDQ